MVSVIWPCISNLLLNKKIPESNDPGKFFDGGEEGTWTLTMLPSPDFKSDASAYSATSPIEVEVRAGVEPALTELQSVALPLG